MGTRSIPVTQTLEVEVKRISINDKLQNRASGSNRSKKPIPMVIKNDTTIMRLGEK
jgi:hypothetical protein